MPICHNNSQLINHITLNPNILYQSFAQWLINTLASKQKNLRRPIVLSIFQTLFHFGFGHFGHSPKPVRFRHTDTSPLDQYRRWKIPLKKNQTPSWLRNRRGSDLVPRLLIAPGPHYTSFAVFEIDAIIFSWKRETTHSVVVFWGSGVARLGLCGNFLRVCNFVGLRFEVIGFCSGFINSVVLLRVLKYFLYWFFF